MRRQHVRLPFDHLMSGRVLPRTPVPSRSSDELAVTSEVQAVIASADVVEMMRLCMDLLRVRNDAAMALRHTQVWQTALNKRRARVAEEVIQLLEDCERQAAARPSLSRAERCLERQAILAEYLQVVDKQITALVDSVPDYNVVIPPRIRLANRGQAVVQ